MLFAGCVREEDRPARPIHQEVHSSTGQNARAIHLRALAGADVSTVVACRADVLGRDVQVAAGCVIGRDYPQPIVNHAEASKANMDRLSRAFSEARSQAATGDDDEGEPVAKNATASKRPARATARNQRATSSTSRTIDNFLSTSSEKKQKKTTDRLWLYLFSLK